LITYKLTLTLIENLLDERYTDYFIIFFEPLITKLLRKLQTLNIKKIIKNIIYVLNIDDTKNKFKVN